MKFAHHEKFVLKFPSEDYALVASVKPCDPSQLIHYSYDVHSVEGLQVCRTYLYQIAIALLFLGLDQLPRWS